MWSAVYRSTQADQTSADREKLDILTFETLTITVTVNVWTSWLPTESRGFVCSCLQHRTEINPDPVDLQFPHDLLQESFTIFRLVCCKICHEQQLKIDVSVWCKSYSGICVHLRRNWSHKHGCKLLVWTLDTEIHHMVTLQLQITKRLKEVFTADLKVSDAHRQLGWGSGLITSNQRWRHAPCSTAEAVAYPQLENQINHHKHLLTTSAASCCFNKTYSSREQGDGLDCLKFQFNLKAETGVWLGWS